ncbi:MAG: GNAT family N-acetyltransferase [Anaerolineae bacterium]
MPSNDFEVQIAHSVAEIGREAWDRLAAGRPFASFGWYRFAESVLAGDTPLYIILARRGQPLARATFWLKRRELLPIPARAGRLVVEAVIRRWPLLVCRAPLANTSGLILPDSVERGPALQTIARLAQEQARQHRASFLVFDYLQSQEAAGGDWPPGFSPATLPDPGTRLDLAWPTFEAYLKHLSKSMRKDYRRHCNRAADLGVEVESRREVTDLEPALALIRNVEARHNSPPNPLARAILEQARRVDATWITARIEGRLAGCGLLLGDGRAAFLASLGIDYGVRYVYFQLLYRAIRCAIEDGLDFLRGGSGAYKLKQRLGFHLENDNYVTFSTGNRALRWVGRQLAAG